LIGLANLKELSSTSTNGASSITVEFIQDTDMNQALNDVKELVETVNNLPSDAEKPEVIRIVNYENVAKILITGTDAHPKSLDELRAFAYEIKNYLLSKGIAKINFKGLPEKEINIEISSNTLQNLNQSLNTIGRQLTLYSQDFPAGTLGKQDIEHSLRSKNSKRTITEIENILVQFPGQKNPAPLNNFANIYEAYIDNSTLMYYQGQPAIELQLLRTSKADSLEAAEILTDFLNNKALEYSPKIKIHAYDQSWLLIKDRINLLIKKWS
jgi:multidrug efflux pump subunit AcrB